LTDFIEKTKVEAKIRVQFKLINTNDIAGKLGTYGIISDAKSFIVGILDKEEKDAVEFGYLFEKIILFATDMDFKHAGSVELLTGMTSIKI
jgi:hypothetical protein